MEEDARKSDVFNLKLISLYFLQTEMDAETGAPKDELAHDTLTWFKTLGVDYKKLSEVIAAGPDPKVYPLLYCMCIHLTQNAQHLFTSKNQVHGAINDGITRANNQATSNAQKIQKFTILPSDFSIPTGELGPTLKVKRNVVAKKYEDIIDKFYV